MQERGGIWDRTHFQCQYSHGQEGRGNPCKLCLVSASSLHVFVWNLWPEMFDFIIFTNHNRDWKRNLTLRSCGIKKNVILILRSLFQVIVSQTEWICVLQPLMVACARQLIEQIRSHTRPYLLNASKFTLLKHYVVCLLLTTLLSCNPFSALWRVINTVIMRFRIVGVRRSPKT